jgi:hypothetical protein
MLVMIVSDAMKYFGKTNLMRNYWSILYKFFIGVAKSKKLKYQRKSLTAKVKIVKNERDSPLFTSKQLIKF